MVVVDDGTVPRGAAHSSMLRRAALARGRCAKTRSAEDEPNVESRTSRWSSAVAGAIVPGSVGRMRACSKIQRDELDRLALFERI